MCGQLLRKVHGSIDPIEPRDFGRNAKLRKGPQCRLELLRRHCVEICKLMLQLPLFDRKLVVVGDDFAQKQRNKSHRKLSQQLDVLDSQLASLRRISLEAFGLEAAGIHANSASGLPCDNRAVKPSLAPNVGTRSVESTGRSITTFSRIPGPMAINQVVRERASPVRWCWNPL